jgi:hypothetical protein
VTTLGTLYITYQLPVRTIHFPTSKTQTHWPSSRRTSPLPARRHCDLPNSKQMKNVWWKSEIPHCVQRRCSYGHATICWTLQSALNAVYVGAHHWSNSHVLPVAPLACESPAIIQRGKSYCYVLWSQASTLWVKMKTWQHRCILTPELSLAESHTSEARDQ